MRTYFYLIGYIFLLTGCETSKFTTYKSGNYIQFTQFVEDSTFISFLFYPDADELDIPLSIEISGIALDQDQTFTLTVNEKRTTAIEGKHFILPEKTLIRAGHVIDTCWLKLKRTPDMQTEEFCLVLQIESNNAFELGQAEKTSAIIRINDKIAQPKWWNDDIYWYYLGDYSDKKYSLFIDLTGIADLSSISDGEKRSLCLKFKYWLESQKNAGNTIREEDNSEMTVPVLG